MSYAASRPPLAKRPLPHRAAALLAALLVLFSWTGDALGLHPCPHHSAVAPASGTTAMHPGGGHEDRHSHASTHADVPPHPEDGHAECTCIGGCTAGAAVSVPEPTYGVAPAPLSIREESLPAADAGLPDRFLPYVLPYGQAPPAHLVRS